MGDASTYVVIEADDILLRSSFVENMLRYARADSIQVFFPRNVVKQLREIVTRLSKWYDHNDRRMSTLRWFDALYSEQVALSPAERSFLLIEPPSGVHGSEALSAYHDHPFFSTLEFLIHAAEVLGKKVIYVSSMFDGAFPFKRHGILVSADFGESITFQSVIDVASGLERAGRPHDTASGLDEHQALVTLSQLMSNVLLPHEFAHRIVADAPTAHDEPESRAEMLKCYLKTYFDRFATHVDPMVLEAFIEDARRPRETPQVYADLIHGLSSESDHHDRTICDLMALAKTRSGLLAAPERVCGAEEGSAESLSMAAKPLSPEGAPQVSLQGAKDAPRGDAPRIEHAELPLSPTPPSAAPFRVKRRKLAPTIEVDS